MHNCSGMCMTVTLKRMTQLFLHLSCDHELDWSCQVSGSRSKQIEVMEVSRPFLVSLGIRPEHAKTTQDLPSATSATSAKGKRQHRKRDPSGAESCPFMLDGCTN